MTNKIYTTNDILRVRDDDGIILTYCIMDIERDELIDYIVVETNTLKEINQWVKSQ